MRYFRVAIYLFALIGLLYTALGMIGLFAVHCEIQSLGDIISQDNRVARLKIEKCDNQATPVLQLEILDQSIPKKSQSVTFASASSTDVTLTWSSSKLLIVKYPSSLILTQEPPELDGIKLLFLKNEI
jgi:hypothetical protein